MTVSTKLLSARFARCDDAAAAMPMSPTQRQYLERVRRQLCSCEFKLASGACPCKKSPVSDDVCIAQIDRYGLALDSMLCRHCGSVRIDPYPDQQSLSDFYTHFYQHLYARNNNLPHLFAYQRSHYGERIAQCYQNHLSTDAAVLEIGCGTGSALLAFADRGCFVAGCDFSDELVQYGTCQGVKNLWTGTLDDAPPSAARQYNLIYLFHVLEHVADPITLLSQLRSKLTPQGRILAVVPDLFRIDCHRNPAGDALKFLHIAHKFNYSTAGLTFIAEQAHLSTRQVLPPPREYGLHENARDLSEMWMEFALTAEFNSDLAPAAGDENLRYLLATEELFQAGQCPAQLAMASSAARAAAAAQPTVATVQAPLWYDRLPLVGSVQTALGLRKKRAA